MVKNLPFNEGDKKHRFDPWVPKIPWRRKWQPTPVFLPGESHRRRSLEGYSSQGCKELDTTEVTEYSTHLLATLIKLWFCILLMAVWSGLGKR